MHTAYVNHVIVHDEHKEDRIENILFNEAKESESINVVCFQPLFSVML